MQRPEFKHQHYSPVTKKIGQTSYYLYAPYKQNKTKQVKNNNGKYPKRQAYSPGKQRGF